MKENPKIFVILLFLFAVLLNLVFACVPVSIKRKNKNKTKQKQQQQQSKNKNKNKNHIINTKEMTEQIVFFFKFLLTVFIIVRCKNGVQENVEEFKTYHVTSISCHVSIKYIQKSQRRTC